MPNKIFIHEICFLVRKSRCNRSCTMLKLRLGLVGATYFRIKNSAKDKEEEALRPCYFLVWSFVFCIVFNPEVYAQRLALRIRTRAPLVVVMVAQSSTPATGNEVPPMKKPCCSSGITLFFQS
ncbi:unnamed protein product [Ixodes pacificus]